MAATGANGCTATSAALNITQNPLPAIAITGLNNICPGSNTLLTATPGHATYQWSLNGTALAGATSATYSASAPGTYTVTAATSFGCTATSAGFVINANPVPTVTITPASSTTLCLGDSVVLNANTGLASYVWTRNGLVIAGATTASYTAKLAGAYVVTGTNGPSCSATSPAVSVVVNARPTIAIANSAASFCAGASLTLSATAGLATYQWSLNGLAIAGATNATYAATTAGHVYGNGHQCLGLRHHQRCPHLVG